MIDRRAGQDRRKSGRYKVSIDVDWEGSVGRKKGTINDISVNGCFILCSGEVEDCERVKLFFPLTNGNSIQLWGEVVNHVEEIGFAMRFVNLTEAQQDFLENFVDTLRED